MKWSKLVDDGNGDGPMCDLELRTSNVKVYAAVMVPGNTGGLRLGTWTSVVSSAWVGPCLEKDMKYIHGGTHRTARDAKREAEQIAQQMLADAVRHFYRVPGPHRSIPYPLPEHLRGLSGRIVKAARGWRFEPAVCDE